MSLYLILSILLGGAMGLCVLCVTRLLINNRVSQPVESPLLNRRWTSLLWVAIGALGCGLIAFLIKDIVSGIEYMGIFLVLMSLVVTDLLIRKIPNELLLMLLTIKLGASIASGSMASLFPAIVGFVTGLALFLLPSFLKLGIGWGDVKLAAVAGFCLGFAGILEAIAVMAIILALYSSYLLVAKKGNLKTSVAMGPPFSVGMLVALLFPLAVAI